MFASLITQPLAQMYKNVCPFKQASIINFSNVVYFSQSYGVVKFRPVEYIAFEHNRELNSFYFKYLHWPQLSEVPILDLPALNHNHPDEIFGSILLLRHGWKTLISSNEFDRTNRQVMDQIYTWTTTNYCLRNVLC